MRVKGKLWGAALGILITPSCVLAQVAPTPAPAPPEVMEPPGGNNENKTQPKAPGPDVKPQEPLTKELNKGEGVIQPPHDVDPGIDRTPPDGLEGRTPVIPPPGEPGGSPDVQPK